MLKIVHFSDLHLAAPLSSANALLDKRFIGFLNGAIFRKHAYQPERLKKAVPLILKENPDLIVFTGDATTCSQPQEFELALEYLDPLIKSGIPILYTPGNHDCYVPANECTEALRKFRIALTGSETAPAEFETEDCKFLIFDSAVPTNPLLSCGYFSEHSLSFLQEQCNRKTKPLVMLSHFPVLKKESGISGYRRRLAGAEPVRELAHSGMIDLILCGHIHKPYEILNGTGRGEICAGSLTKAGLFRTILFDRNTFSFENKWIGP